MARPRLQLCMVGYGSIADCHMQALSRMPQVMPRIVVGRRADSTGEFAHRWGFSRYTLDLDEALGDPEVDVVVVTTPNELHAAQAIKILNAGKLPAPRDPDCPESRRCREDRQLVAPGGPAPDDLSYHAVHARPPRSAAPGD